MTIAKPKPNHNFKATRGYPFQQLGGFERGVPVLTTYTPSARGLVRLKPVGRHARSQRICRNAVPNGLFYLTRLEPTNLGKNTTLRTWSLRTDLYAVMSSLVNSDPVGFDLFGDFITGFCFVLDPYLNLLIPHQCGWTASR